MFARPSHLKWQLVGTRTHVVLVPLRSYVGHERDSVSTCTKREGGYIYIYACKFLLKHCIYKKVHGTKRIGCPGWLYGIIRLHSTCIYTGGRDISYTKVQMDSCVAWWWWIESQVCLIWRSLARHHRLDRVPHPPIGHMDPIFQHFSDVWTLHLAKPSPYLSLLNPCKKGGSKEVSHWDILRSNLRPT